MTRTALIAALLLTGCGAPTPTNTAAAPDIQPSGPAKRWDATDACAVIDKAAMAVALGTPVAEATVALVHPANGAEAATSECSYILQDGGHASVMLRWSPIADNNDAAIASTKNPLEATIKAFGGSVTPVEKLGKAAFWVEKIGALNVFL